jgi:hypothetical protein
LRNEAAAARRGGALGPVSLSVGGGLRIGVGSIRLIIPTEKLPIL